MPDLASRRLARTSWVLLPIDETMPIPVTTTRLMNASSASRCAERALLPPSTAARLHHLVAEQTDLEVHRPIDDRAVRRQPTVGDAEHELAAHDALDVDAVDHVLDRGQNLAGEFQFAQSERASLAGCAHPAQEKAEHDRIALKVAGEEPQVRLELEHGAHQALAVLAAGFRDLGYAVEHEHGGQRQLGIAGAEEFAPRAGQ